MHKLLARLLPIAFAGLIGGTASSEPATDSTTDGSDLNAVVKKGLRVAFDIAAPESRQGESESVLEGAYADVSFRITDATTGAPVPALEPAVWITRDGSLGEELDCHEQISRHLQGLLSLQADIDLNKFFLLVMNNDQTISVVDPLLGVNGITQLYAMIVMKDRGEDWAFSADGERLFVTMPRSGAVAVVDLGDFKVEQTLAVGEQPVRVALQPDGRYFWVGNDSKTEGKSGVTVIDARSLEVVGFVPTGVGHHEIAFSADSLAAFVTNSLAGTVSVIDTQALKKTKDLTTTANPIAVALSPLSGQVYVGSQGGNITFVDAKRREVSGSIETAPGLVALRFSPDGRWGFAANLERDQVTVVDASTGTIAHRFDVGDQPHQVAFTGNYAYVRHLGTPEVTLVPLAQLGKPEEPGLKQIPLGNGAPGDYPFPALADAISPTGEWTAVVSANPADRMVYYYMEGMIAPMGSYSAYGRVPRAVGVVDRSLREVDKGVYGARIRVPKAGSYRVAFLVDAPAVHHCFSFEAAPDPAVASGNEQEFELNFLDQKPRVSVGEPFTLRFSLTSTGDETSVSALDDVTVLATRPPFNWQTRERARALGDGRYEVDLLPDQPGVYLVSVGVASLGLDFTDLPYVSIRATANTEPKGIE